MFNSVLKEEYNSYNDFNYLNGKLNAVASLEGINLDLLRSCKMIDGYAVGMSCFLGSEGRSELRSYMQNALWQELFPARYNLRANKKIVVVNIGLAGSGKTIATKNLAKYFTQNGYSENEINSIGIDKN